MEEILALSRKVAEEAEVFSVSSEETTVRFETNRLKHLDTRQAMSVALRVIKGGRLGYATATSHDEREALVRNAVETAQFGSEAKFQLPALTVYPMVHVLDAKVKSVPIEEMVRLGEEMIARITDHTPGILCEAGVSRGIASVHIMNSQGGEAIYEKSFFNLGLEGNLIKGEDMLFVGDSESSCHPIASSRNVADSVLRQLEMAKRQASAPTRTMPVIFTPNGVAATLIAPFMTAFNGKTVFEGASPVGNKLGQAVFDGKLSLWDDPTLPYRPGSRPCDDEGVPSQRTPLVEGGRVANFLYDLQTAALAKTCSTGSGVRRGGGLPAPAPSAFIFAPGDASFEEMVRGMREGLVIEQLMGAEQGNILGGDFSGNVLLGYKVERGEVVGRVKNTIVSGNVYHALKDGVAMGRESRWVGDFLQTPHIYCAGLSVASKG